MESSLRSCGMFSLPPKNRLRLSHSIRGYSLTELAVVLVIIGLVVGLSLSAAKTQLDVAAFKGTQERLNTIRDALQLFQKKYQRYPCPALPTDNSTSATYGQEVTAGCDNACPAGLTCNNNAVIGAVRFRTLRLNEELAYDAWDSKITYAVDKDHTVDTTFGLGAIPVQDGNGNEITASPVLGDAIFILISHGQDGKGSYSKMGTVIEVCDATAKDGENCDGDDVFADTRFNMGDIVANYYDDLLLWQTQEDRELREQQYAELDTGYYEHTCALKEDQTAWCWGSEYAAQLGNGEWSTDQLAPVKVLGAENSDFIDAGAGVGFSCFLKRDGTVWCVHQYINSGALTPVSISDVVQISIEGLEACALKDDGTIWCWDGGNSAPPAQLNGLSGIVEMQAAGSNDGCAIKNNGTVWCWGNNSKGQLGNGTTTPSATPVQVSGLTGAVQAARASYGATSCALKANGTVWCWGGQLYGAALGNGQPGDALTPVKVSGLARVVQIMGGIHSFFCALKDDGTVWCWGYNGAGQLGTGNTITQATPAQTAITDVKALAANGSAVHACARKTDSTIWCWGENNKGQLGNGTTNGTSTPVQVQNFP
jgi:alpha-tubulin suppressor-like RCC1 family protein/type II secretory pathway pseudopilin PulG